MITFEVGRMLFASNIVDMQENEMKQNRNDDEK